jgi:hypothetical protein
MVLQRIYDKDKTAAGEYREVLKRNAPDWGFDEADVAALKKPVLVRVLTDKRVGLKSAVRKYNEVLTQEMDVTAMQVATSARIGDSIIDQLKKMAPDETLLAFLQTPRSRSLVLELQRKGVITKQQTNKYIGKDGLLSEDGRRYFGRALVGRILPNADALDLLFSAKPSLRPNLARAVPFILLAAVVAKKWDIANAMPDAARIFSAVRAGGHTSIKQYLAQRSLFASGVQVTTASLLLAQIFLDKGGPLQLSQGFAKYADKAAASRTVDMWGPPPPPVEALAQAFGLTTIKGPNVLAVTSFSPTAVSTARKNGKRNGNNHKSRVAQSAPAGGNGNGRSKSAKTATPKGRNGNGKRPTPSGSQKRGKPASSRFDITHVSTVIPPDQQRFAKAAGESCKGGLTAAQAAAGSRLFFVDLHSNKHVYARKECYRSTKAVKYVVTGVPFNGELQHAISWHTNKAEAVKARKAIQAARPLKFRETKLRQAKEDKRARQQALRRASK